MVVNTAHRSSFMVCWAASCSGRCSTHGMDKNREMKLKNVAWLMKQKRQMALLTT